ncbi:endo-1,4-beta-xylanase 2-like [Salvia divinorum]|uniref:Endo-1,4-beta-xylanase 2-like n=1 Tax=Salvia divinorum TaxID=28513 RepID=A0ABD1HAK1_SALDI
MIRFWHFADLVGSKHYKYLNFFFLGFCEIYTGTAAICGGVNNIEKQAACKQCRWSYSQKFKPRCLCFSYKVFIPNRTET